MWIWIENKNLRNILLALINFFSEIDCFKAINLKKNHLQRGFWYPFRTIWGATLLPIVFALFKAQNVPSERERLNMTKYAFD
jgi:hypothetical protein